MAFYHQCLGGDLTLPERCAKRRLGVLRLHPVTRATRLMSRALPLRHHPFQPHATRALQVHEPRGHSSSSLPTMIAPVLLGQPRHCRRQAAAFLAVKKSDRRVSPKKSLVKIGEPSHTRRFASERGEFSSNGSLSGYSARVGVKGSPILGLRRQRRLGARLRGKQGRQSHLIPCGSSMAIH
jgi:hypothetical protein